jgi:hypothetical protein
MLKIRFEFDDEEYLSDSRCLPGKQKTSGFISLYRPISVKLYRSKDAAEISAISFYQQLTIELQKLHC